ncbi:hypothetical protein [Malikia spinosa]|uniref:hypothetical protein n=1 Tax=Malikia spinosa TaxID=86180 RepID=UPI0011B06F17|nr:hypothetical protein [Malikia spinosa]
MSNEVHVEILSEAWMKEGNNYMNIDSKYKTFFPDDCFIARGTGRENKDLLSERGIWLQYEGAIDAVQCFMELRSGGKFRPSNRGAIKDFYSSTKAQVGDKIVFEKKSDRIYGVKMAKCDE